jgi:hypothetical protein
MLDPVRAGRGALYGSLSGIVTGAITGAIIGALSHKSFYGGHPAIWLA